MKLTGKCKIDFEKYRLINYIFTEHEVRGSGCSIWEYLDDNMKYGVYVDFFDSVDIFIQIETRIFDKEHPCYIYSKTVYNRVGIFKTRQEARTAAITKANEICNGRY